MKYRINEIFYSIQGEGYHTGTPAVFIRFAGCNQQCPFCDTAHEKVNFELSEADLLVHIARYFSPIVILTGGEPALQITSELIAALHLQSRKIHVETNGTLPLPEGIDWITLSPKNRNIHVTKAHELKLVYDDDIEMIAFCRRIITADHYYLQPKWTNDATTNTHKVIEYIKQNPIWRLSLQTHKLIGIL